jgi:hypothetical protein
MKKVFIIIALCACYHIQAVAQISEGATISRVIRTGNRPESGTFGVFIGPSLADILDMADRQISWRGIPLINLKYYTSSQLEFRLGLQFYSTATKEKGTLTDASATTLNTRFKTSYNRIMPGIAYHFSSKNILDVYLGVAIPLGYEIDNRHSVTSSDFTYINKVKRTSFIIGAEAFIGLQCFIADLPLSLGLEYGLSGLYQFGQKYKHEIINNDGTGTQIVYTKDGNLVGSTPYSKLNSQKGEIGSDLRITISYYFNNKQ